MGPAPVAGVRLSRAGTPHRPGAPCNDELADEFRAAARRADDPVLVQGESSAFHVADGSRLKPEFAASMDRLREWNLELRRNYEWAICLDERFERSDRARRVLHTVAAP